MLKKILLITLTFFFIIGIGYYLFLAGICTTPYLSKKINSPDGKYFAQIQDSSCGGGAGDYTTGVMIANAKSFFSNFDNTFAKIINVQIGNTRGVFGADGSGTSIKTTWIDNRTLKISLSNCGKTLGKSNSWKDIKIIYEGTCSTDNQ